MLEWKASTKRGTRDQQMKLRGLAGQMGYEAIHALHSDGWHLLDRNGKGVKAPDGRSTFTVDQAITFLKRQAPPLSP